MTQSTSHSARRQRRIFAVVIALLVGAVLVGIGSRLQAQIALRRHTEEAAAIVVATIKPSLADTSEELVLPGNVQAFADAPIYARTSGYLKRWLVDIGAKVKKGQLLAEIDTPEVDQQLLQAQADLATAEANNRLAQSTARRWIELLESDSVSKQDADEKIGDASAKKSLVESARANVERLRQTQSFKHIEAPFSGVVTARNIDIGALVSAASGTELFRIAASDKLRVYVQAPQSYAPFIKVGQNAELQFAERPGRVFSGKLARTTDAIDPVTRTLLLQIEVDNVNGELLPGSYVQVHLQLNAARGLRLPVNALIFRAEGLQVATVTPDKHIALKRIALGRDLGMEVEVISGLNSDDTVVLNPPDSLSDNQAVQLVEPAESAQK